MTNFVSMRYRTKYYQDYFIYLLGFETPAISVGNTIMQDGYYDTLFYKGEELSINRENLLIEELMGEHEDIKEFNEDKDVLTIHDFVLYEIKSERIKKLNTLLI